MYKIVLLNGGVAEYNRILQAFNESTDNQERKYAMFTLGAAADPALKMRTLEWAVKGGDVKLQDFFYPLGSVAGNLSGTIMAWQYLQDVRLFLFYFV